MHQIPTPVEVSDARQPIVRTSRQANLEARLVEILHCSDPCFTETETITNVSTQRYQHQAIILHHFSMRHFLGRNKT